MEDKIIVEAELVEDNVYDIATLNSRVDIESKVDQLLANVSREIASLNLGDIKAEVENKGNITNQRVKLNNDLKKYAEDIKEIGRKINEPLDILKEQFAKKVKPVYEETIAMLQGKIDDISSHQLQVKIDYSKEYYENKLKSVTFRKGVAYEDIPHKININSSLISMRTVIDDHFESVEKALIVIDQHEFKEELEELWIKHNYNIGDALAELQLDIIKAEKLLKDRTDRERKEREELEFKLAEEKRKREEEALKAKEVVPEPEPEPEIIKDVEEEVKLDVLEEVTDYLFELKMTESELSELISFLMERNIIFDLKG